ncbi:exosome complex component MTR3 [Drosophila grimshawi]|uniref:GH16904 n=1 Tax=Drosophila grimshawi TaxID=7222 RepID=B4IXN7_DROGR|nr:exosome complex component MTR3 [Drosophila grimshawi]EDV97499.1 GH16904 [Drosophila grimshawi]
MLRITQTKNTLLDGATIAEQLYATPKDCEQFFESIEKPTELVVAPRSTFIRAGVLTTVRGSAYMEYGNTKMMAIVAPPRELVRSSAGRVNMGVLNCYVNFAAFASGELASLPEREKHLGSMLTKALEPLVCRNEFLNFQLDIRVLILDDDGCLLSTAINCCGVALVECGISTYDLIAASTACIYRDQVFLNPSAKVEELLWQHRGGNALLGSSSSSKKDEKAATIQEYGLLINASMDSFEQLAQCQQCGYLKPETYVRLLDYTLQINKSLRELIKRVLTERVKEQHVLDMRERDEERLEDERLATIIERLQQQGLNEFIQSNIKEDPYTKK